MNWTRRSRDASTVPKAPATAAVAPPEKSIAVLPFENLSDSQENEYFADGIQDDVLANLAKIADLKVISRTSVRQYKTGLRNLREIGEALGVAHILEGTVRRAGNRVRVNVQLINARTDAHIWADTFDRELLDLFALQSELAEKITVALRANLSPREKASLRIHSTADLEAYENYLRARDLFRWSGAGDPRENGEKALRFLERAVKRDPQFALAYCQISRWHTELYWFGYDRKTARVEQGKAAAEMALRLQPDLGDAHLALAYYHYFGFRDYDRARAELEIARRTTPNDAEVWDADRFHRPPAGTLGSESGQLRKGARAGSAKRVGHLEFVGDVCAARPFRGSGADDRGGDGDKSQRAFLFARARDDRTAPNRPDGADACGVAQGAARIRPGRRRDADRVTPQPDGSRLRGWRAFTRRLAA